MVTLSSIKAVNMESPPVESVASSMDPGAIEDFLSDESLTIKGSADRIFFPENEAQAVSVVKWANETRTPLTVSGGGTGITGSRVPLSGAVLSMNRLVNVREIPGMESHKIEFQGVEHPVSLYIDDKKRTATVAAGLTLADFVAVASGKNYYYPPNPTEWTCQIGGNIATNASGARSFKYGSIRDWVKRVRVILPTGHLLEIDRGQVFADSSHSFRIEYPDGTHADFSIPSYKMPDVKNASGLYSRPGMDLIDLFIGSEGILGVFTEVEFGMVHCEDELFGCIVFFASAEDALGFVKEAREKSRDPESRVDGVTIDYFDANSLDLIRKSQKDVSIEARAAVFFEQFFTGDPEEIMMGWMELFEKYGVIEDWSAMTDNDRERLRLFRHSLPETVNEIIRQRGVKKMGMDLAVPDDRLDSIMEVYTGEGAALGVDYVLFGHIGDNNLHMNFMAKNGEELEKVRQTYLRIAKKGIDMGGTISAEHGVGKKQFPFEGRLIPYLELMYNSAELDSVAGIKKALDPGRILNRGNIIPESCLE